MPGASKTHYSGTMLQLVHDMKATRHGGNLRQSMLPGHAAVRLVPVYGDREPSALHCSTSVCIGFAGVPMEYIEHADEKPELISIARCRELLGEEAESMTT